MSQKKLNRRQFLQVSAAGAAGLVIASCTPAAAPTTAPEAPVEEAPKAAAATPTPRVIEAATATPVPTLAEAKYKEAPALAEMVAAGTLPPVEERLPVNPLVLAGVDGIGKYGGRLRKFWPGAGWNGHFLEEQYGHSALRFIDDGLGIAPGICDEWSTNADNSEWTFHFREGLKWSDGQPAGVDDVMFWWNDLVNHTEPSYPDSPPDFGTDAAGKLATFEKVDDFTLKIKYGTPSPLCAKRLAMWVNANIGPRWIAPKHYLEQFHPKYNKEMTSFEMFNEKASVFTNPEMPTLTAWMLTKYEAGKAFTAERNPYYYAVDTEGNQLPYIDGSDWIGMQDRQVELLQVRQGTIDHVHFHSMTIADISTLLDGQDAGNYEVVLWDSGSGTGMMYFWNHDYPDTTEEGKKIAAPYRNPAFKRAMSHALDRATIQKTVYYNTGFLTTGTMSPKAFEFNFNAEAQAFFQKARDAYVEYNPDKAKELLAEAGYAGEDILIDVPGDAGKECMDVLQIAEQNWKAVGINVVVNTLTPTVMGENWKSGKGSIHTNWEIGDGPDHLLYPSWVVPNEPDRWAPLSGRLFQYLGTTSEMSEADKSPWDRAPQRFNKEDPQYVGSAPEKLHALFNQANVEPDEVKRAALVWDMWNIHIDEGPFVIGTVANYPRITIKSKNLMNYPYKEQLKMGGFVNPWIIPYPAVTNPETWSYK